MNREDYEDVLNKFEKATDNEVFCDVMCRFPYELNEEQLTEVCERCPLNNTLDKIRAEIWDLHYGNEEKSMTDEDRADAYNNAIKQVIEIIDKYKESEELYE